MNHFQRTSPFPIHDFRIDTIGTFPRVRDRLSFGILSTGGLGRTRFLTSTSTSFKPFANRPEPVNNRAYRSI